MDKRGRKIGSFLRISVVLMSILLGFFAEGAWAQPFVISQNPPDGATNILINTSITIQFNMTMDTASSWFDLEKDGDREVTGTLQWGSTAFTNDTLVFVPQNALSPAAHYRYQGNAQSAGMGGAWFEGQFITKPSSADTTPPTVQTVYPRNGMTGVSTGERIHILFSEAMNPGSVTAPGNITVTGPGSSDYIVTYDLGDGDVQIAKSTPFSPFPATYTVTITTNVRDVRGNPLKTPYSWSFNTGPADGTPPTVAQRVPAIGDTNVSLFPQIHVVFSEEMDETTLNTTNITLNDTTPPGPPFQVPINIYWSWGDYVTFGPQSPLTYSRQYTVTIGTGVKDRAGGIGFSTPYSWSFTTAASPAIDSDPILNNGMSSDEQFGQRWNGVTTVDLRLSAWDEITSSLNVTATSPPSYNWPLNTDGGDYSYMSPGNEGLSNGYHLVTFTIQDGAANTVTFQRNIYIFSASPTLSSPASGATGVPTTPTFQWSYSGGDRPMFYNAAVFDGPDPETARMVWMGFMVDLGSGTHSITIPFDKQLAPNTTYYWGVRAGNKEENGETIAGLWPFTTGGTPPPAPLLTNTLVRSDNRTGGMRWNLSAKVGGPSPADITELKVTGPGGFQYIFTEDDINQNEQSGLYYYHDIFSPLSNGTYTFSVTDSQGMTDTATADFTNASIPIVGTGTMLPADNTYVNSTTPTFYWGSVGVGYYYRIQIMDWNSLERNVYISSYSQETQATVPAGYLLANTPYKWRVEAFDPTHQNRSASDTLRFSTGSSSYVLDLTFGGVWSDNSYYGGQRKSINAIVMGPLPNHVQTPPGFLTVTGPGGFTHTFSEAEVAHSLTPGSQYSYGEPGFALNGNYTFTVQDINLATDTPIVKNVTTAEIPIVDQAFMLPANNAYLNTLTPTFSWAAVSGMNRYYRVTINDWSLRYPIYQSARSAVISDTIPAGILKPNRSYKWRVEVFDSASGAEADNRSTSAWNCFTTPRRPRHTDFDGDSKTDVAVYDVANGWWYLHNSEDGGYVFDAIGVGGGSRWKIVSGDYDGDGKTDVAVYDAEYGWWLFHYTAGGYFYDHIGVGGTGYTAVPGNYDGDGVTDIAVYNQTNGDWYIKYSSGGYGFDNLGGTGSIPLPADYDGDGKTDVAVYDVANGWWYLHYSSDGSYVFDAIGVGGGSQWRPVPGDYDGDRKADVAVYDAQNGWWLFHYTAGGYFYDHIGVGGTGYGGVPGDYDGDGVTDIAVYNETNGYWYVKYSSGGYGFDSLGGTGSVPVNQLYLLGSGL